MANKTKILKICIVILLSLVLLPFILAFGWIAGIVCLFIFWKKNADNPDKRKKYTIGIGIPTVLSLAFVVYTIAFAPPSPTELTLRPTTESAKLDVNSDYIINLSYEPEDATLSNITYTIDNPSLATLTPDADNSAILTLHTIEEGTITIIAKKNTIESNTLTFEIIDEERIAREKAEELDRVEAERKKLEEEQAAKAEQKRLEEEKRLAEEKAQQEAEQKRLAEEQAAKEAEEKRLAEEKAAQKEAQRLAAEQAAAEERARQEAEAQRAKEVQQAAQSSTVNNTGTSTAQNTTPAPATTEPVQNSNTTAPVQSGTMVWIDRTAKRYHDNPTSCGMSDPYQVTLEEAQANGKTPCGRCYK